MFIEGMEQCSSHLYCLWEIWISALVICSGMEDTEQSISHLYLLTTLSNHLVFLLKTNFSFEKFYIYLLIQIIIHSSNCTGHCAYEVG